MEGGDVALSVDNKVVKMTMEATQFLQGAASSISALKQLQAALKMEGAVQGLDEVAAKASSIDLIPLENSVEGTRSKFSLLAEAASVALGNIMTKAIETGASFAKAFTFGPALDGLKEYELKMNSIQTIMMGSGESLDRVNQKLGELNTYSDKTIYSFQDMTSNIGKFINAGVNLDDSVAAIQGVANVAAISGANANEASHAMYNFGQALSSGSVRLEDWKSIEIANMATVEFKNELIKAGLEIGTLVEQEGKYVSTTTDLNGKVSEAFDATSMFNTSLSSQWMTTEVLTKTLGRYADETTEIGKKAYKAASQVKTLSQLMDTTSEAIGTGWADTWEILVGDYQEAIDLWTKVSEVTGDYINKSAAARNDMLRDWKEMGGRAKVIEGLENALSAFGKILSTIGSAWREVFPATTADQLMRITNKFVDFTAKMKISDDAAKNLKDTFRGLFSALDVVRGVFANLLGSLPGLGKGFGGIGEGLLQFTGNIGRYISGLRDSIKETDFFKEAFNDFSSVLSKGSEKIADGFKAVVNKAKDFGSSISEKGILRGLIDKSKEFKAEIQESDTIFSGLSEWLGKIFNADNIAKIAGNFGKTVARVWEAVGEFITNVLNSNGLSSIINAGMFTRFLDDIKEFTGGAKNPLEAIKNLTEEIGEGASNVLNSVTDSLEAFQSAIKANTLLKIAGAITVLATAIIVLGTIDGAKLAKGLGAVAVLMAELFGSLLIFEKLSGDDSWDNLQTMGTSLLLLSGAVVVLAGALKLLEGMEMNDIAKGLITIAALSATLVIAANKMDRAAGKMISTSAGLILFAQAVKQLAVLTAGLGQFDTETLVKGVASVVSLVVALAGASKLMGSGGAGIFKGAALIEMAYAIKVLSDVVKDFADMDGESLIQGLAAVGIALSEIGIFSLGMGGSKHILSTAAALGVMSLAITQIQFAVAGFASIGWEGIAQGLTGMAGALIVIGVALAAMPSGLAGFAVSLGLVSAALTVMAYSMQQFGSMEWSEIGRALVAMAGGLTVVGIAVQFMQTALPGAAALLVISAAMALFAPVMKTLGGLKLKEVGVALLALGGAFAILGVAGIALTPAIPAILSFAAALTGLALVIAAVAAAIVAITGSALFGKLADGFGKVGDAVGAVATQIQHASLVELFKGILISIITLIPDLAVAMVDALEGMALAFISAAPVIAEAVVVVITSIASALTQGIPVVVDAAMQLILAIGNGFITYGPQLIAMFMTILLMLIEAITTYTPVLVQAGIEMIVAFVNGIANGIRENQEIIFAAVRNLISALIELVLSAIQELLRLIPGVGDELAGALEDAKNAVRETLAPESMEEIGTNAMTGLNNGILNSKEALTATGSDVGSTAKNSILDGIGDTFGDGSLKGYDFANGLSSMVGMASTSGTDLATAGLMGLASNAVEYGNTGTFDGTSFSKQLAAMSGLSETAGIEVTSMALNGLNSNSGEYGAAGNTDGTNFSNELSNTSGAASSAGSNVGAAAVNGVTPYVGQFQALGSDAGQGFANGIAGQIQNVATQAGNMVRSAIAAAKAAQDSNSPSKEFMKLGVWADEGIILGYEKKEKQVSDAAAGVVEGSLKTVEDALNDSLKSMENSEDYRPTVTPVVDLSEVVDSASKISGLLDQQQEIEMAAKVTSKTPSNDVYNERILNDLSKGLQDRDRSFVDSLKSLRDDFGKMIDGFGKLKVVMDNGALVGELAGPMDEVLGQRLAFAERGM